MWWANILGMVVEVKQMPTEARLAKKKHMGLWSRASVATARLRRFPKSCDRVHTQQEYGQQVLLFRLL